MGPSLAQMMIVLGSYVVLVLLVGAFASRRGSTSPEEYFLAGRGLGKIVLFMALFGTNATAFVMVGIPGLSYREGVGVFGLNAAIVALGTPLTFVLIGVPAYRAAARLKAMTPSELYARRFGSPLLGHVLFFFFTVYTLPYMVTAVKGASLTLSSMTQGGVSEALGGFFVLAVALLYTLFGGMRATAWTNVIQGSLFLGFMLLAFFLIPHSLGGFVEATRAVRDHDQDLLRVIPEGRFELRAWASWGLVISLTVIAFPHMLVRMFAARSSDAIRSIVRLYPLALIALWLPAVLIGVWGAAAFPGLEKADEIFSRMVSVHLPSWLGALGFVAVLAAVMSTLDAQLLTLSSMLVRLRLTRGEEQGQVFLGRLFVVGIAVLVYGLALVWNESIFDIASYSFSGYTTLTPTLFFSLRWKRFTWQGAIASVLLGNFVLLGGHVLDVNMGFRLLGFLPIFWALVVGVLGGIVASLLTDPPDDELTRLAWGERS